MIRHGFSAPVCEILRSRPFQPTSEWAERNVTLPRGSEIRGRLRLDLFPHAREVFAVFDDPYYTEITLQWGSRLGKTVCAQTCCAKIAATNPNPMAWADADQKSTERVLKRLWQILAQVPALADHCPPPRLRAADKIEFPEFLIHGAWAGSANSAADYAAAVVVLNELDKYTRRRSDEADFAELMAERAKGFTRSKVLRLSTPSYRGRSRIEAARLAGDNRGRFVPCPQCNGWQQLWTGDGLQPGGLRWEKPSSGRSDPELARETAWYECRYCGRRILDGERFDLLNSGVWVPEGMTVTGSGKLRGRPVRSVPHASFGPLPTLYSLLPSITWGAIAYKFLTSRGDREQRRNYHNSWESLTWDDTPQKVEHVELAMRLCTGDERGTCPAWCVFLTRGVDVQADGHTYWWSVWGWGRGGRGALVDWGVSPSDDALRGEIIDAAYPHADGGGRLKPQLTLIDSGDGEHTQSVYQFCRQFPGCLPCKGPQSSAFPGAYRLTGLDDGTARQQELQRRLAGRALVLVNGEQSQWWIERVLSGDVAPHDPRGWTLPRQAAEDGLLLEQLTNEYPDTLKSQRGYEFHTWKKRGPNEWRDSARYAWVAAQIYTRQGQLWDVIRRAPAAPPSAPPPRQPAVTLPDGRPFLVTER
jgi:phage terminase large subunit GpA-like protein